MKLTVIPPDYAAHTCKVDQRADQCVLFGRFSGGYCCLRNTGTAVVALKLIEHMSEEDRPTKTNCGGYHPGTPTPPSDIEHQPF